MRSPTVIGCIVLTCLILSRPALAVGPESEGDSRGLDRMRQMMDLAMEQASAAKSEFRLYQLKWTQAADTAKTLKEIFRSRDTKVLADARLNSLIVVAPAGVQEEIDKLLQTIDRDIDAGSYRVEVTLWEVSDPAEIDRRLKDRLGKNAALPIQVPQEFASETVLPELIKNGLIAKPTTFRGTTTSNQTIKMQSGLQKTFAVSEQNSRGIRSRNFERSALGSLVELITRRVGDEFVVQFSVEDSRVGAAPDPEISEPPTLVNNSLATTLRLDNGSARLMMVGGAGGEEGQCLLIVLAIGAE